MPNKTIITYAIMLWLVFFAAGCKSFNGQEIRQEHAGEYPKQLAERTQAVLVDHHQLDLNDCIRIALRNNLTVKSAEIQQRVARLEQKVSFANFLPAVSLGYQKTWWDPLPQVKFSGGGFPMHDKEISEISWDIQLSIFNPATWFLYSMYSRGYEIAELVTEYTRQAIALQVTTLYYQCLSLEQTLKALDSQLTAASAMEKEFTAYRQEGLVSGWQEAQGRVLVLARRTEINYLRRSMEQAKAELLASMGLDPLSDITLKMSAEGELKAPEGLLEELIAEALLCHPNLAIADRRIAIEKEKVKVAIAGFLPQLTGFASRIDTSDSHQIFTNYWMAGLNGVVTVFNGFANFNQYEAAKERQKDAFLQREQASLALMLQVIRASDHVQTANDQMELTKEVYNVAVKHLEEVKHQYEQGLVQASDMLTVAAEADKAKIQYLQARFQYQTSIAMLLNVMGKTKTDFEEPMNEPG
jgi:outer membrane protein TolC